MFASPGLSGGRDASTSAQVLVMVVGATGAFSSPDRALLLIFVLAGTATVGAGLPGCQFLSNALRGNGGDSS